MTVPHWVYEAYGIEGQPLYVGVSSNVRLRMYSHKATSAWYPEAAFVQEVGPMPMEDAYAMEADRVAVLSTAHNKRPGGVSGVIPGRNPTVTFSFLLPAQIAADVTVLAQIEDRTRSNMIRRLLAEATAPGFIPWLIAQPPASGWRVTVCTPVQEMARVDATADELGLDRADCIRRLLVEAITARKEKKA